MKRITSTLILFLLTLIFTPGLSYAAMYQWTDKNGNLIITDDPSKVPEESLQKQPTSSIDKKTTVQEKKAPPAASPAISNERSKPARREIPSNDSIRKELLASAKALASAPRDANHQDWAEIEKQLNKLMTAANNDRTNILRELLCYCSYDIKGGAANELVEYYGFMAIQTYYNFTEKEVMDVTQPYLKSNDLKVKNNISELLKMARQNAWQKRHDHQMQQIEKMKSL